MVQITFTCKVISPMFIGNASTEKAELRPSAIKASMRFWWRAIHPDFSAKKLRMNECKLFGGSYLEEIDGKKETVNNAPKFRFLSLTINNEPAYKYIPLLRKTDIRPHKGSEKFAIKENSCFSITLLCKEKDLQVLINLMHISSALGGLGNRSRRGAGAWEIIGYQIGEEENVSINYSIENIYRWINLLNNGNYQYNDLGVNLISKPGAENGFPYLKKIEIGIEYATQDVLRKKIMVAAHNNKGDFKGTYQEKNQAKLFSEFLGKAMGGRFASPIYVSMLSDGEKFQPIISTLNHSNYQNQKEGQDLQTKFKNAILNNVEPEN